MVEIVSLEEARREFWEAWNGLSEVHTQKDLEAQSEKMWTARKRLLRVDPEFRATLKAREDEANVEAERRKERMQIKHEQIMTEAEAEVSAAKMRARAVTRMSGEDLDVWVQKHKFKVLTPEKAKTKSKLVCPICRGPDRGNILNDKPACLSCFHKLVPVSELGEYNRQYRRKWKRNRKK